MYIEQKIRYQRVDQQSVLNNLKEEADRLKNESQKEIDALYVSSQRTFIERLKREHPKEWAQANEQKTTTGGMAHTQTTPDGRQITYLPNGQKIEKRAETVRTAPQNMLTDWEKKAKKGGMRNILYTISYDFVNQPYICLRAFAGLPDKSLAGTGLNRTEKFENGLQGFASIAFYKIPLKLDMLKGFNGKNTFQEFSKLSKGSYRSFDEMWQGFHREMMKLELNKDNSFNWITIGYLPIFKKFYDEVQKKIK